MRWSPKKRPQLPAGGHARFWGNSLVRNGYRVFAGPCIDRIAIHHFIPELIIEQREKVDASRFTASRDFGPKKAAMMLWAEEIRASCVIGVGRYEAPPVHP
jgi:hypothetical protein